MKCSEKLIISAQKNYAKSASRNRDLGLIVPEAFVRGIRHIGYKSNVEAIAELVDNSIQAYAERVDLVLGYADGKCSSKPTRLAVIDDGHGMSPEMLRFAMMWGGTHRYNDRNGLGRFGFGLPCATVSMGRCFTIYSKVKHGNVHAVSLDLDLLDGEEYRSRNKAAAISPPQNVPLPAFARDLIAREYPHGWQSGTIVVVEKLDRLGWATATGLRRNLVRHFGVAYHKLLAATGIHIDGERVRPIDPLFLAPDGEFYDLDEDRAQALDPVTLRIDGDGKTLGEVTMRYAWLPPTFAATDKSRDAIAMNANQRFPIIKQYHGIVFSRNSRVVDVQSRTPWTTFINNDRYIRVEIEFSASLDEAFGVTTSKQQVSVSLEMWDLLRVAGLAKALEHLRAKVRTAKAERARMLARPAIELGTLHADSIASAPASGQSDPSDQRERHTGVSELTSLVRNAVGCIDPATALDALLRRIQRCISIAHPRLAYEYEHLLRSWIHEMSRASTLPRAVADGDSHHSDRLVASEDHLNLALLRGKQGK